MPVYPDQPASVRPFMELPVSITALCIAYGVVFIGAILQGSIGFGLGTFAVPLLLLVDPIFVPAPLLSLALVLAILMYYRERGAVQKQDLKWSVIGRFFGTIVAALLLTAIPQHTFTLLVALLVLLAITLVYSGFHLPINTINLLGIGALSGFMSTTASIGGPPMAMLYYEQEGPRIRGTLSGIFFFGTIASLTALAVVGRFGRNEIRLALLLSPALLLGFLVSRYSARFLDRGYIRPAILTVSGTAAAIIVLRYFF